MVLSRSGYVTDMGFLRNVIIILVKREVPPHAGHLADHMADKNDE